MRFFVLSALLLSATPTIAAPDADLWLQGRMNRIAAVADKGQTNVRVRVTDGDMLRMAIERDGRIAVPRRILALADNPVAVDGLLALILSYARRMPVADGRPGLGADVLAAAAFVGSAAAVDSRSRGGTEISFEDPDAGANLDAARAQAALAKREAAIAAARGLAWGKAAGGCRAATVDYLRDIATSTMVDGRAARLVLADLGSVANDPDNECLPLVDDRQFGAIQTELRQPKGD